MADIRVRCACGHEMVMSEFAVGMHTKCASCGNPLTVNWQNSRPLDSEEPVAPGQAPVSSGDEDAVSALFEAPEAPGHAPDRDHCANCDRPFRGEWDRHETSEGLLCNICTHLARPDDPVNPSTGYVAPMRSVYYERDEMPVPGPPSPDSGEDGRTWWERNAPSEELMQKIALYSGIAVIVVAVLVFVFSGSDTPEKPTLVPGAQGHEAAPVRTATSVALWGIYAVTRYFGAFLGLYLFLTWGNRLPNERFLYNLMALAPIALGVMLLTFIPFMGWVFAAMLIFTVYGFEWGDLLRLPASGMVARVFEYFLFIALSGLLKIVAG